MTVRGWVGRSVGVCGMQRVGRGGTDHAVPEQWGNKRSRGGLRRRRRNLRLHELISPPCSVCAPLLLLNSVEGISSSLELRWMPLFLLLLLLLQDGRTFYWHSGSLDVISSILLNPISNLISSSATSWRSILTFSSGPYRILLHSSISSCL